MRTFFLLLSSLGIAALGCGSVEVGNNSGSTSGGGSTSTSSAPSSTSSGGASCGGEVGGTCGQSELCFFADSQCGGNDGSGTCTSRPHGCDDIYHPVCACDGKTYANECEAAAAGFDVNAIGGCPPPKGMFGCGIGFCTAGTQYCQHNVNNAGTATQKWVCQDLPPACMNPSSCACFDNVPCGKTCMPTADGGFVVTCEAP